MTAPPDRKGARGPSALTRERRRSLMLLAALWLGFLVWPAIAPNNYILSLGSFFAIYLILIASLNLLMGFAGQISLAHGAFFGLGAYTSGVLAVKGDVSPWIGLPGAFLVCAALATLVGIPALRLKGHYLAMATLGLNAIMTVLFNELVFLTGGPNGLIGVPGFSLFGYSLANETAFFYFAWTVAGLVMLALLNLIQSRPGRALRSLAGNEIGAACLGINVTAYKVAVFAISAGFAGVAGSLYVHKNNFASPETFSFFISVLLVVMVALGGWGRYWGAFIGAAIYVAAPEVFRTWEDMELFMFGLIMILVMLFFPSGLVSAFERLGGALGGRERAR